MTKRERYEAFAKAAPDLPVFFEPTYLDAVAGDDWDFAIGARGDSLVGVWPYVLKKKWGKTWVVTPPLLRYSGPYLLPEFRTTRHENHLYGEMLKAMPKLASFDQDMHPSTTNGLGMHWQGFTLHQRYTYVLPNLENVNDLWDNVGADYRNNKIPKADDLVKIKESDDATICYDLQKMSYERQSIQAPFSLEYFQKIDKALSGLGQRKILIAEDKETKAIHAACYLVFDKTATYFLLAGDDPDLRRSGAGILLAWESIRYAAEELKSPRFDFLGSMTKSIERVRRNFGAEQQPYLRISNDWSRVFKAKRAL